MKNTKKLSVIITTYNQPQALQIILRALKKQSLLPNEVIIADDGSSESTHTVVKQARANAPFIISHVWQSDEGFQAAKIRNKAVAKAQGNYIIFIDGDCVPPVYFCQRHQQLSQKAYFCVGNRVLLNEQFSQQVLAKQIDIATWDLNQWKKHKNDINRLSPLFYFPLGQFRTWVRQNDKGAKTCNLALWREDFLKINGFDEVYSGWGYEDSDLVVRLLRAGIKRKSAKFAAPVLHLWHQEADRQRTYDNWQRLQELKNSPQIYALLGVDQYT